MAVNVHLTPAVWNTLTLKQKKALVKDAGYAPNVHAYRTLENIPYNVRIDVQCAYERVNK